MKIHGVNNIKYISVADKFRLKYTLAINYKFRQTQRSCECGNEPSGSIKRGEFLDYLTTS
jgi:hypothetical protein